MEKISNTTTISVNASHLSGWLFTLVTGYQEMDIHDEKHEGINAYSFQ